MKFNYQLVKELSRKFNLPQIAHKNSILCKNSSAAENANKEAFRIVTYDLTRTLVRLRKISTRTLDEFDFLHSITPTV
jgi:hypothetical protein